MKITVELPESSASPRAPHPWTRRQFVRGAGFGALGMSLPEVLRLRAEAHSKRGKAKSCILIFLFGGPSQIDTFDMKPDAPAEFRGEFKPIDTSVPGLRICEHMPRIARVARHLAVVRSVTMTGRVIGNGDHHADTYYMLTGRRPDRTFFVEGINRKPHGDDWPFVGSTVSSRVAHDPELPGVVQLPCRSGEVTGYINPGQFSGLLGPNHEPVLVRGTLEQPRALNVPQFALPADLDMGRIGGRRGLADRLDEWSRRVDKAGERFGNLDAHNRKAVALLTSAKARQAFDLGCEPARVRERYGNEINAQSVLMARRLVEAGVPFVAVHWLGRRVGAGLSWDTHSDNFGQLKKVLLPPFDSCLSALLEDLETRGLLESTLVAVTAEMGRTPKVGDPRTRVGAPGRDHWINLQSCLFAGGGIRGGQVYGSSDKIAAYPRDCPVGPEHLAATIYHAMGLTEEELVLRDRTNRPLFLTEEGARPLPLF